MLSDLIFVKAEFRKGLWDIERKNLWVKKKPAPFRNVSGGTNQEKDYDTLFNIKPNIQIHIRNSTKVPTISPEVEEPESVDHQRRQRYDDIVTETQMQPKDESTTHSYLNPVGRQNMFYPSTLRVHTERKYDYPQFNNRYNGGYLKNYEVSELYFRGEKWQDSHVEFTQIAQKNIVQII